MVQTLEALNAEKRKHIADPNYGPLGRQRTISDDFFEHRHRCLMSIRQAIALEKAKRNQR